MTPLIPIIQKQTAASLSLRGVMACVGLIVAFLGNGLLSPAAAQVLPKTIEPQRFDKRFEKSRPPRSIIIPEEKEEPEPAPPENLKKVKFVLHRVDIQGATRISKKALQRIYKKYLRKRISIREVYRIAHTITVKYRNAGFILSKAIVPPQRIGEEGRVLIQVIEGYIANVKFQGPPGGSKKLLKAYRKKIMASRPLSSKVLERYLLLMNDLPGVTARSVLTPSTSKTGASELLIILEQKRVDAFAGVDNRGSKFNGPIQVSTGVSSNSVLGLYERAGVQAIMAAEIDELIYLNLNLELPVSLEGTRLMLSGSFSESEPGEALTPFQIVGNSSTFLLRASHPFLRSRGENLSGSLGFSFKNSETDILGVNIFKDQLRVLDLGMNYDFSDRYKGINVFRVHLHQGLDAFGATESGSPKLSRPFGKSDFTKLEGKLLRVQQLAPRWNLLGSLVWQYAFNNLLAAEEFVVGGARVGRGFDPSEITGDSGVAGKLELQYSRKMGLRYFRGFQVYVFSDYGMVWHRSDPSNLLSEQDLYSAGGGVRFNATSWLSGYLEIAKPFGLNVASEGDKDPRFFFSLNVRY